MTLGDRVAVLRDGRVQQVGPPMELYRRPVTRFVGSFIGSPAMNLYRCRVVRSAGVRLEGPGFGVEIGEAAPPGLADQVWLGIRPHDLTRVDTRPADFVGRVELVEPRGSDLLVQLRLDDESEATLAVVLPPQPEVETGDEIAVRVSRDRLHYFDPEDDTRIE